MNIDEKTINTLRFLSIDQVNQANSGHPGAPMGAATIAYVLFKKIMNHKISRPTGLKSESNKLKLLHADTLFIDSRPNPSLDNETCCLGERNFECFPVPIISKSSDS